MLNIGTKAPDFALPDQNGETRKLSDFGGKRVILSSIVKAFGKVKAADNPAQMLQALG